MKVPMPKVSVITPVYNGEKYLKETILSVLNQTFDDFEYLLVNHASTDSSLQIMQQYQTQDNRIKIIQLDINKGGPAYPRNEGVKAAQGEFIAFVDADDIWKEDKLQIQIDYFKENPAIDMIYSRSDIINEHGDILVNSNNSLLKNFLSIFLEDKKTIFYTNFININTLIMKNNRLNSFREDTFFIAIEDWMFHILNFYTGKKGKYLDESLIYYRIHTASLSNRTSDISYRKIFYMYSILLLDFKIPLLHFIFANVLNTCKILKRKNDYWRNK